tara:strand:- start:13753 stop:13989 length:237 start_codon:yes stop_codon:yes gene_type:complete
MIHYLVIGHACDEEQGWQFTDSDKEWPVVVTDEYLEQKFTNDTLKELGYEPDEYESCGKEVYIDFILKSNSPIQIQYG